MPKDPVRSLYQCQATHGSYTRCTLTEDHSGPHSNASYVWNDKPTADQKAKFQEAVSGRTAKSMGIKNPEES